MLIVASIHHHGHRYLSHRFDWKSHTNTDRDIWCVIEVSRKFNRVTKPNQFPERHFNDGNQNSFRKWNLFVEIKFEGEGATERHTHAYLWVRVPRKDAHKISLIPISEFSIIWCALEAQVEGNICFDSSSSSLSNGENRSSLSCFYQRLHQK